MEFLLEQTDQAIRDKELIFNFLVESYQNFGDDVHNAVIRAADRIKSIEDSIASLSLAPNQGTLHPTFAPNMRSVTKNRAIFWFTVSQSEQLIRLHAIFFGGQDHYSAMRSRLSQPE